MPSTLGDISKCLESTSNRAKIFRIAQYGCLLVSGSPSLDHDTQKFLLKVSSSFSDTRKALRLLDDFASLNYTLNFGLGHSEPDPLLRVVGFLTNIFDTLYYPCEHIAWLMDHGWMGFSGKDARIWSERNNYCWALSLELNVISALRSLWILRGEEKRVKAKFSDDFGEVLELKRKQRIQVLSLCQASLDLCNALNWMPPEKSFLSGQLATWQVGLFGTLSTILMIYKKL